MNRMAAKFLYAASQNLRGKPVLTHLKSLEQTENYSPGALRELQWTRLKNLLAFCYENIPYYKNLFNTSGVAVEKIRDFDDFKSVPILTKDQVRNNLDDLLRRNSSRRIYFSHTSGSTGKPVKIGKDHDCTAVLWAASYRGRRWHGLDIGDPGAIVRGLPIDKKQSRKQLMEDFFSNQIRLNALNINRESVKSFYYKCLRFKPRYIYGFPSGINQFAEILDSLGLDGRLLNLKRIITTGELLHTFQKENIESFFETRVINEYGSHEFGVCAFECPKGKLHISAENIYVEINETERLGHDSSHGEALITGLVNHAMPLVRYSIGDVLTLSDEKCSCGRGLPLVNLIEGRTVGFAKSSSGEHVNGWAFGYLLAEIFKKGGDLKQCKFIQSTEDLIRIKVVRGPCYNDSVSRALEEGVRKTLGPSIRIKLEFVDRIPPEPSGKFRFFASEISEKDRQRR